MIYTMPKNTSIQDLFARDSSNAETILTRLAEGLTSRGYVLGSLGVYLCGIGDICVDADRDPSQDWITYVPPAQSSKEITESTKVSRALAGLERARAGTLTPAGMQEAVAFLLEAELRRRGIAT